MKYEHLHVDISPAALELIADALESRCECGMPHVENYDAHTRQEIQNFINECRARVQHAAAGEPDISEDVPGCSETTEGDWLS